MIKIYHIYDISTCFLKNQLNFFENSDKCNPIKTIYIQLVLLQSRKNLMKKTNSRF